MTHSLSVTGADNPPAMYRKATLAMVVSSTSMNVGITTAAATIHGLITRGSADRMLDGGGRAWMGPAHCPGAAWSAYGAVLVKSWDCRHTPQRASPRVHRRSD